MSVFLLRAAMAHFHGPLQRARLPVLWGTLAMAALAILWRIEDPLLKRV